MFTLTDEAREYAVQKLLNLVKVNKVRSEKEKEDALSLFGLSLGLSEEIVEKLTVTCWDYYEDNGAYVYVGILIGLAMGEYASEHEA